MPCHSVTMPFGIGDISAFTSEPDSVKGAIQTLCLLAYSLILFLLLILAQERLNVAESRGEPTLLTLSVRCACVGEQVRSKFGRRRPGDVVSRCCRHPRPRTRRRQGRRRRRRRRRGCLCRATNRSPDSVSALISPHISPPDASPQKTAIAYISVSWLGSIIGLGLQSWRFGLGVVRVSS